MRRTAVCFGIVLLGVLVFFAWTLVSGPVDVSLRDLALAVFSPDEAEPFHTKILWELRFPRAVAAVLAGVALSVSGLCLQTVFRNPLCGPYVLGISSGASLGVAVALLAGFGFGALGVLGAASVGAILVTQIILVLASRFRNSSVLLVAGLLVGYFVNALVNVLVSGADAESLQVYVSWGLGSFGRLTLGAVPGFAIAVLVGLALVVCSMRYLNAIHMGDDFARGLGVRVGLSRICVLLGSSVLAGAATAYLHLLRYLRAAGGLYRHCRPALGLHAFPDDEPSRALARGFAVRCAACACRGAFPRVGPAQCCAEHHRRSCYFVCTPAR